MYTQGSVIRPLFLKIPLHESRVLNPASVLTAYFCNLKIMLASTVPQKIIPYLSLARKLPKYINLSVLVRTERDICLKE